MHASLSISRGEYRRQEFVVPVTYDIYASCIYMMYIYLTFAVSQGLQGSVISICLLMSMGILALCVYVCEYIYTCMHDINYVM